MPKELDKDIHWLLHKTAEEAEICAAINGDEDPATLEDRRAETVVRRLVREAGYALA